MIEPPQYEPSARRRYTREQVKTFLGDLHGHPAEALFVAALFVQLREGELFALTWPDLDLREAKLLVERTMTDDDKGKPIVGETTKTRAGLRAIAIPQLVVRVLREHHKRLLAKGVNSDLVFPDSRGGHLRRQNVARRWLRPIQNRCTCGHDHRFDKKVKAYDATCKTCACTEHRPHLPDIDFHELRHTGASLLKELGADLVALKERLGHESTSTSEIYVHLDFEEQRKLSAMLDRAFGA